MEGAINSGVNSSLERQHTPHLFNYHDSLFEAPISQSQLQTLSYGHSKKNSMSTPCFDLERGDRGHLFPRQPPKFLKKQELCIYRSMLLKMNGSRDTLQASSLSPQSITHKGEPKSPKRRHQLKKIKHSQIREMVNQTDLRNSGNPRKLR